MFSTCLSMGNFLTKLLNRPINMLSSSYEGINYQASHLLGHGKLTQQSVVLGLFRLTGIVQKSTPRSYITRKKGNFSTRI
jgi:hypothetical protein